MKKSLLNQKHNNFLAGLISIDIVGHSKLKGNKNDIADTRAAFKKLIESQIDDKHFCMLPWQGDGCIVVFDIESRVEEMVIFADKIRQLVPLFNRTKGELNKLPCQQEIVVRIVCHAGEVLNKDGDAGSLCGEAINLLAKKDREVGQAGYIVLSNEIYNRLENEFKERCQFFKKHPEFGPTYIVDGRNAFSSIILNDNISNQLKDWIKSTRKHRKYDRLLYFAYTNELLYEFLVYELKDLDIKILLRNWVTERKEEDILNKELMKTEKDKIDCIRRRWFKSPAMKARAENIVNNIEAGKSIDMRFFDAPPLFNGAILENTSESEVPCACIGISKWVKLPEKGGSQYKLEEWPAVILDGRNKIHAQFISNLQSRFWEIWEQGKTYEEVLKEEEVVNIKDPSIVGKIWGLDGKPYLIIYPHRKVHTRKFPVVAHEDVMAFHIIESFLNEYEVNVELSTFPVPDIKERDGEWFPGEIQKKVEDFEGHVIYLCSLSISPDLKKFLLEKGFPYEIVGIGTESPELRHLKKSQMVFKSPSDMDTPQARDYSIIAKFERPQGKGIGYIAAGIRGMGTWGATEYLTDRNNIKTLSQFEKNKQFVAIVETEFDPGKYKVVKSRLHIAPEEF